MTNEELKDLQLKSSMEVDRLKDKLHELYEEKKELERRINNAFDYVKSYMPNYDFDHSNLQKLINILEGEEIE